MSETKENKKISVERLDELSERWWLNLKINKIMDIIRKVYMEHHGLKECDIEF